MKPAAKPFRLHLLAFPVLIAISLIMVGCGRSDAEASTVVYFGNDQMNPDADCSAVFPVSRDVSSAPDKPYELLRQLFAGPTTEEKQEGYNAFFSDATAMAVRSMTVTGGTAYVNLADIREAIPNAGSSCGSAALMSQIEHTLKQFPQITRVILAIDSSTQKFYDWIQVGCSEANDNCDDSAFGVKK